MKTFHGHLRDIDDQAAKLASRFENLEPGVLVAFRDWMVAEYHTATRQTMAGRTGEEMVVSRTRAEVFAGLGAFIDNILKRRMEPEVDLKGPEDKDE